MKLIQRQTPKHDTSQHLNVFDYTLAQNLNLNLPFRNIGLKYVAQGLESYTVNGKKYALSAQQLLVVNQHSEGKVEVGSQVAHGICIDIDPRLLADVISTKIAFGAPNEADAGLADFITSTAFHEQLFAGKTTHLGVYFEQLSKSLAQGDKMFAAENTAFYYTAAERLVADLTPRFKQLQRIKAVKIHTRSDLYERVAFGKYMLSQQYAQPLVIANVARAAGLSEYHFFRLFRQVFGLSPHQYLTECRIEAAKQAMLQRHTTLSEVALAIGFADIFSFSKAFKKHTGVAPSVFAKR